MYLVSYASYLAGIRLVRLLAHIGNKKDICNIKYGFLMIIYKVYFLPLIKWKVYIWSG